jgi:hypothetical protein
MEEGSPSGGKPLEAAAADQLFCSWYDSLMCSYWRSRFLLAPAGMV